MAIKQFYHDIDLVKVGQLVNSRIQNISTADRNTLGGTLDGSNTGLQVWDTDIGAPFVWDGSAWVRDALVVNGDVVFQGAIDASTSLDAQADAVSGNQYVVSTAGTLTMTGVTFTPSAVAEVGDMVLFTSTTAASVLQRNAVSATTELEGIIELATQSEVNAGTDTTRALTPSTFLNATIFDNIDSDLTALNTFTGLGTGLTTSATNLAAAINEHETQINNNDSDIAVLQSETSSLQTEVDKIETTLGTVITDSGTYAGFTGTNYIDGNSTLTEDLTDIDTQVKTNADDIVNLDSDITSLEGRVNGLEGNDVVKTYFAGNVTLSANSATNIDHNLGLSDKDAFTIRVADTNSSEVSVDVDAVNVNRVTLTSLVALSGVKVTIIGF